MSNIPSEVTANENSWWASDTDNLSTRLFANLKYIMRRQSSRDQAHITYFKLQNQQESVGPSSDSRFSAGLYDRLTLNVIRQATEALGAKLSQEEVKAICLTEEGNFRNQNNAKKLEQFIDGNISRTEQSLKSHDVFKNAATFGKGFLKSFIGADGRLQTEVVLSAKIKFDEDETLFAKPKSMYQVEYYDKDVLIEMYPKMEKEILESSSANYADDAFFHQLMHNPENSAKYVRVVEGWRLGKRHTIAVESGTLVDEPYPFDYFPFTTFSVFERLTGVWNEGITERLIYNQFEINKTLRTIGKIVHIGCVPKVFVDASGDLKVGHFNNAIGEIMKYTGAKPEFGQLMTVPKELWEHLQFFLKASFDEIGMSEMLVTGEKPKGVYSAKGQAEHLSVGEGRIFGIVKAWQKFHMDTYNLWIKVHADSDMKGVETIALGEGGLKKINFDEIQYDKNTYVLQLYSGNLLSKHPATKRMEVGEMVNLGLFDRDQAMDLLDFPDIKRVTGNELAPQKLIKKIVSTIVETGQPYKASEELFLEIAIPIVTKAVAYYKTMDSPPETLPVLEEFSDDLIAFQAIKEEQRMQHEIMLAQAGQMKQAGGEGGQQPTNQAEPQV